MKIIKETLQGCIARMNMRFGFEHFNTYSIPWPDRPTCSLVFEVLISNLYRYYWLQEDIANQAELPGLPTNKRVWTFESIED